MNVARGARLWTILQVTLLLLAGASSARAQTPPPRIFFTDLDSGPNAGGESVGGFSGAYVTIYGNFFGSSQGSSTVTWNGQNCLRAVPATGSYTGWGTPYLWYQKIIVQLGPGCAAGSGNFVVTVNAQSSNGVPFTVRSGHIFFTATTGSDSNSGGATSPKRTFSGCMALMSPGDTCYFESGVVQNSANMGVTDTCLWTNSVPPGTSGNNKALVAYPGATTVGVTNCTSGYGIGNRGIGSNAGDYWTIAGLSAIASFNDGIRDAQGQGWRLVANEVQCPSMNGQEGCLQAIQSPNGRWFGNEVTNVSTSLGFVANKQQHAAYVGTDSNHFDVGWNYIHDNKSCRALQFHSSPLNGGGSGDPTGKDLFDLSVHDNYIFNDPCDGINFASVDPSQGRVEAYNNIIAHTGTGPSPQGGDSGDYSCIYMAYITNNGPVGTGIVEVYNNTLYDCGSNPSIPFPNNGAINLQGGVSNLLIDLKNNIFYQLSTEPFITGQLSGWQGLIKGSNNVWFGGNQVAPSLTTGNITADPMLVSPSAKDFHLQSGSPAIDAGITVSSINLFNGYQGWNGSSASHEGVVRPQGAAFDIGAYEYFAGGSTVQKPSPPTNLVITVQ
jgi:hypothetical protein